MKRVTIRDVADAAGVSYVTVSNVINGKGQMTEKTRKKVLACIKKMKFHPDETARTLVSGKSNSIAFISEFLGSPFVNNILGGVEKQLFDTKNFDLNLTHNSTKGIKEKEQDLINDMIYGQKADAVIMLTIKPGTEQIREFKKAGIPLVLIENQAVPGADAVRVDNFKGGFAAGDFLAKKGKRNICVVDWEQSSPEYGIKENPGIIERIKGFKAALKENGVEFGADRVFKVKYFIAEEGKKAMGEILEKKRDTDAIFSAAGDIVALGAIQRAKKEGIRVPEDISVVGYDDVLMAEFTSPALTTVRQPLEIMGRKALDLVLDGLKGRPKTGSREILMIPDLIIRQSA